MRDPCEGLTCGPVGFLCVDCEPEYDGAAGCEGAEGFSSDSDVDACDVRAGCGVESVACGGGDV